MGREGDRRGGPKKEGQAPVTGRGVIAAVTALAVVCAACGAGWHRVPQLEPGPLAQRQQVEVWSGGAVRRWHAVRVGPDSISGVSFLQAIACDSCRTALPRSAVDSVRFGDPVGGFWGTFGTVVAVPGFILLIACVTHAGCATRD